MEHRIALESSLELAVARTGDPQPAIYARLFALHPGTEAEFWRDTSGRVRGEMLARSFEMCLDLASPYAPEGGWGSAFMGTEALNHESYGIPRTVFADFMPIVADEIRAACGDGFTPSMAAAWDLVLARAVTTLAALPGSSGEARVINVDDVLPPVATGGLPLPMR